MITATFLAIFFIPLFYVLVVQIFGRKTSRRIASHAPDELQPQEE